MLSRDERPRSSALVSRSSGSFVVCSWGMGMGMDSERPSTFRLNGSLWAH